VSRMARRRPPVAAVATCRRPGRPLDCHARTLIVATLVAATALLAGCDRQERILTDEPFRLVEPDNAELLDEMVDDGGSLIKDGERSVLRIFVPRPPAEPTDVVDVLVAEGERTGWEVVDRSPLRAVARKEVEGRQWTASVSVEGDRVRQLLAGR
jgi:type IV pilus biogenesis protein CpaD/CtpE